MAQEVEENPHAYVYQDQDSSEDGTVDLKGRPVLRSKTGRWKACSFIIVYEIFERLAYQGIGANLVLYLTRELHQGTVTASNNVTNWNGVIWMTPIFGAYIADARLGRFWTFVFSSAIYLMGMCILTIAVSVPALRPPSCAKVNLKGERCPKASPHQTGMFYLGLYIIAVGNGGTKANISTFGADQFDDLEPKEKSLKLSFFNWWVFSVFFGFLISETAVVYIQDNVGWALGYGLPTAGLGLSILVFLFGVPFYRHRVPSGSPFTKMARVIVAAFRKWKVTLPLDSNELYELSMEEYAKSGIIKIDHTPSIRFLDKAAVITNTTKPSPWSLTPVTHVEETKQIIKLLPVLLATFIPGIISAQSHTLFVKQGTTLDRRIGPHSFSLPPACLQAFATISMLATIALYDRCLVPLARRLTANPRGLTLLQRLGAGLALHVLVSLVAFSAERKRLGAVGKGGTAARLTVLILVPQFALMGIADAFLEIAKQEMFYDQAPRGMKSLGASFFTTSMGVGCFLSSVVLTTVSDVTKRNGQGGWVLDDLNVSRLDCYYAFLAVLAFLNLVFFLVVARFFVYNVEVVKK